MWYIVVCMACQQQYNRSGPRFYSLFDYYVISPSFDFRHSIANLDMSIVLIVVIQVQLVSVSNEYNYYRFIADTEQCMVSLYAIH